MMIPAARSALPGLTGAAKPGTQQEGSTRSTCLHTSLQHLTLEEHATISSVKQLGEQCYPRNAFAARESVGLVLLTASFTSAGGPWGFLGIGFSANMSFAPRAPPRFHRPDRAGWPASGAKTEIKKS